MPYALFPPIFVNECNFVVACTAKLKMNVARRANKLNKNVVMLKKQKN
jgi:hypothetical protein